MHRRVFFLLLGILIYTSGYAQILPQENSDLNYRLVGFTFPAREHVSNYTVEVAEGTYNSRDSFIKHIVVSFTNETNRIIGTVPSFGTAYTWRILYSGTNQQPDTELHHFHTMIAPQADEKMLRFRIIKQAEQYKNAYFFVDCMKALYDMTGKPVWFMPGTERYPEDIKLSAQGTITFLNKTDLCEINYNDAVIWEKKYIRSAGKTVTKDTSAQNAKLKNVKEIFHHDFTRLSNGHYMVLAVEVVVLPLPAFNDSTLTHTGRNVILRNRDSTYSQRILFGTIMEYDKSGKLVWTWRSSEYFLKSDVYAHTNQYGMYDRDVHENSFYFDEQSNNICVGFRDISRILKIHYPDGAVLSDYNGEAMSGSDNALFCGQHSCKLSQKGYVYLFNNGCDALAPPSVLVLKEPGAAQKAPTKIWEYTCTLDGTIDRDFAGQPLPQFTRGGNVTELPDQSMFVSMSGSYSKIFIVDKDKKILWSGVPERWDAASLKWKPIATYRASIITSHKDLEQLIWAQEAK